MRDFYLAGLVEERGFDWYVIFVVDSDFEVRESVFSLFDNDVIVFVVVWVDSEEIYLVV
jgi:hypothetical protein